MTLTKDQKERYETEAADEANRLAPTRAQSEADFKLHIQRTAGQTKGPHELESEEASAQRIQSMAPVEQANECIQAQAVVGVEPDPGLTANVADRNAPKHEGAKVTDSKGNISDPVTDPDVAKAAK